MSYFPTHMSKTDNAVIDKLNDDVFFHEHFISWFDRTLSTTHIEHIYEAVRGCGKVIKSY